MVAVPYSNFAGYSCGKLANAVRKLAGEPMLTYMGESHSDDEDLAILNKARSKADGSINVVDYTIPRLPTVEPCAYTYG